MQRLETRLTSFRDDTVQQRLRVNCGLDPEYEQLFSSALDMLKDSLTSFYDVKEQLDLMRLATVDAQSAAGSNAPVPPGGLAAASIDGSGEEEHSGKEDDNSAVDAQLISEFARLQLSDCSR